MRSLLLALLLSLVAAPALAEDQDLAREFYVLGEKLYRRGDYDAALKNFQKAYQHSTRAELIHNMARCHEVLNHLEDAIRFYTEYRRTNPPNAAVIDARIANLRKRLESRGSSTSQPAGEEGAARPLRLPGWLLVGVGGALLVTGGILGGVAMNRAQQINDASRQTPSVDFADYKDTEQSGKNMQAAAIATLAIGGAAAVTGAVLLILDARRGGASKESERSAWIVPGLARGGGAVIAGGVRF
jgi:tetratricopeptide (TPR) repeat protein